VADNHSHPLLTESDITSYCTEQSFQRGEDYDEGLELRDEIKASLRLKAEREGQGSPLNGGGR